MASTAPLGCCLKFFVLLWLSTLLLHAKTYYVAIAGLGGDPEYESQFSRWSADLDHQLKQNGADKQVQTVSGSAATREHIHQILSQLATQLNVDDAFALILIGHGTFDGETYKFNVPGPDVTAGDLREWLSHFKSNKQLVANLTSCSGASMAALAAKDRIVITATKSGNEKNATVFPRYFIDALHDPAADTDKNGVISALEAFRYAQQRVAAYFTEEKLIASEHALFSDTGLSNGVRDPGPHNQQGLLAASFPLFRSSSELSSGKTDPAKQKLIGHKDDLEAQLDRLKYQKESLPESQYKQQLTALLLDLARTQAEIDK